MAEKQGAGRPTNHFLSTHFTKLEKKSNKSNRYFWDCNYCSHANTAGRQIEGRDNKLLLHIIDTKACPNAPVAVRQEARVNLMQKGHLGPGSGPILASPASSHDSNAVVGPSEVTTVKKRKGGPGTLDHYVDHALSPQQKAEADVKFFRLLIFSCPAIKYSLTCFYQTGSLFTVICHFAQQKIHSCTSG